MLIIDNYFSKIATIKYAKPEAHKSPASHIATLYKRLIYSNKAVTKYY